MTGLSDEQLRLLALESSKTDLGILIKAKEDAKRRVMDDPSKANLDAFDKAGKMLFEYLADKKEPAFANRMEALAYLKRQGYSIEKSKLYGDVKKGLLQLQSDRSVLEKDVGKYIRKIGLEKPADIQESARYDPDLSRQEQELKVRKMELEVEEKERKKKIEEGDLISRSEHEIEVVSKLAAVDAYIRYLQQYEVNQWRSEKAIDGKDTQDLLQKLNQGMDDLFNSIINLGQIEVTFEAQEEESVASVDQI